MDIVELLRVQEQKGVFDLPDDHKFVGWGEAADEIERLREQAEFERAFLRRALDELQKQDADIERLREALESIADNTCCDGCQEAALVARKATGGE